MKAYIHVPFCATRCRYCDFYSQTNQRRKAVYIESLKREFTLRREEYSAEDPLDTVYFGGGTPSLLNIEELTQIINALNRQYSITSDAECTIEANPNDLSPTYLADLYALGFNRISLGIQAFDEKSLRFLGRRHDAARAIQAVKDARTSGFENLSIDLMYGIPGQSTNTWHDSIKTAIALAPTHISAYHLIYENGTPLTRELTAGVFQPVTEDESLEAFDLLIDSLDTAGYTQYEISNFALDGYHSRHNSAYWQGLPYLGFGPSAHTYDGVAKRRRNIEDLDQWVMKLTAGQPAYDIEALSLTDRYNEAVLCGLRQSCGLRLSRLANLDPGFPSLLMTAAKPYISDGLLRLEGESIDRATLKLSRAALFISDTIMSDLFHP